MAFDVEKARNLNSDHHRRMAADAKARGGANVTAVQFKDEQSREKIVGAMLGCVERWELPRQRRSMVLEFGAGMGGDKPYLENTLKAKYVGIEVVPEVAQRSGVQCMALEEAPGGWNNRFDYIYSRHVMEHVTDVDVAISTLKRLLAPKGVIGAVTPHYFPDPEPAHITQLNINAWIAEYKKHGLKCMYAMVEHFACEEAHLVLMHEEDAP